VQLIFNGLSLRPRIGIILNELLYKCLNQYQSKTTKKRRAWSTKD